LLPRLESPAGLHCPWSPYLRTSYPFIEGTGGFFISDRHYPDKIYLVTARHIIFHPDQDCNEVYQYINPTQPYKNALLLLGNNILEKYIKAQNLKSAVSTLSSSTSRTG